MALFGNSSSDKRLPEYRVAALASFDLEEHLKENPLTVDRPGHIEWMVNEDDEGRLVARGAIRIPVELYFIPEEDGENAEVERVVINGKRQFDTRVEEEEEEDNTFGIDMTRARTQSFNVYRNSMKS